MSGEETLTLVIVLALITAVVAGIMLFAINKVGTEAANGKWLVYSTSPSLEGTSNTYTIGEMSLKIEGITAVDYFYKSSGEKGIVGVKLTFKNESKDIVKIPLGDAFFTNSHGKKVMTEVLTGYKEFSKTPSMVTLKPSQTYEISLVAYQSQRYVKVGNTSMWLVTLLAKEDAEASFYMPILENGKEVLYEFKLKFFKKES
jgi:hypothetical protein